MDFNNESASIMRLCSAIENRAPFYELEQLLWSTILAFQGKTFYTSRGLAFSYVVKRGRSGDYVGELVVNRKEKSKTITKSTVFLALKKALVLMETEGRVSGPKKLGTFGASYLYPVFLKFGMIRE